MSVRRQKTSSRPVWVELYSSGIYIADDFVSYAISVSWSRSLRNNNTPRMVHGKSGGAAAAEKSRCDDRPHVSNPRPNLGKLISSRPYLHYATAVALEKLAHRINSVLSAGIMVRTLSGGANTPSPIAASPITQSPELQAKPFQNSLVALSADITYQHYSGCHGRCAPSSTILVIQRHYCPLLQPRRSCNYSGISGQRLSFRFSFHTGCK